MKIIDKKIEEYLEISKRLKNEIEVIYYQYYIYI